MMCTHYLEIDGGGKINKKKEEKRKGVGNIWFSVVGVKDNGNGSMRQKLVLDSVGISRF